MPVQVIGADVVAAAFAGAAVTARAAAVRTATQAAQEISDEWERILPVGPTGITSSDPMNYADPHNDARGAGATAVSEFFVARFLQFGTVKNGTVAMPPKVDLFGHADPHIERWLDSFAGELDL